MNRNQQSVIENLLEENRILKQQFESTGKKLRLDNHQRRNLAKRGKAMGWAQLQKYATLVRPETILGWHRKLIALKYTGKRVVKTDRQERMDVMSVADFFTVEVWTLRGLVRYHVFFVMNLAKRHVEIVHIGCQVNGAVMSQLARNMTDSYDGCLNGTRSYLLGVYYDHPVIEMIVIVQDFSAFWLSSV